MARSDTRHVGTSLTGTIRGDADDGVAPGSKPHSESSANGSRNRRGSARRRRWPRAMLPGRKRTRGKGRTDCEEDMRIEGHDPARTGQSPGASRPDRRRASRAALGTAQGGIGRIAAGSPVLGGLPEGRVWTDGRGSGMVVAIAAASASPPLPSRSSRRPRGEQRRSSAEHGRGRQVSTSSPASFQPVRPPSITVAA